MNASSKRHEQIRDPLISLDREAVRRRGFLEFVRRAWDFVEPVPYVHGWHIEEMCKHGEALILGEVHDLLVNVPPGMSKSTIYSVMLPAWSWIANPGLRWITASYDPGLSYRDAKRSYDLVTSDWFVERWGKIVDTETQQAYGDYYTTAKGFRFATSVGGRATGRHCHVRVVDDPIKPADAQDGRAALGEVTRWWRETMSSRRADPNYFKSLVVMQRLHVDDLSAACVEQGYTHLCLPMRYDPERRCETVLGGDRRTLKGEILAPNRISEDALAKMEFALGPLASAAQLDQNPAREGGRLFSSENFQRFSSQEFPFGQDFSVLSVDCSFKAEATSDFVALELWTHASGKFRCYDSICERLDFDQTLTLIETLAKKYKPSAILIEDKANGPAIISILRKRFANVIALNPKSSKTERAQAANVHYQAKAVYHLQDAAWLSRKEGNLLLFPRRSGRHDDDVDATSMALLYLAEHSPVGFIQAMQSWRSELSSPGAVLRSHYGFT